MFPSLLFPGPTVLLENIGWCKVMLQLWNPKYTEVEPLFFSIVSTVPSAMPQEAHAGWTWHEQQTGI